MDSVRAIRHAAASLDDSTQPHTRLPADKRLETTNMPRWRIECPYCCCRALRKSTLLPSMASPSWSKTIHIHAVHRAWTMLESPRMERCDRIVVTVGERGTTYVCTSVKGMDG